MTAAAVLSIGTELTRGELLNGNARWLADRLVDCGFIVVEHSTVPDDAERIRRTLLRLAREVKVIVCTGGLGPTSDDLTTAVVADALGVALVRDTDTLAKIEARYRARKQTMPAMNVKQADFPAGANILPNGVGTAPGFAVQLEQARAYFMPGVPSEMQDIFEAQIVPELSSLVERRTHQVHIRTYGLFESAVAERLRDLDLGGAQHDPGITIGYRATFPEVEVKVLAEAVDAEAARVLAERVAADVRARLGDVAFGGKNDTYVQHVGRLLRSAELKVAVAESCTGGLLGKLLTDQAGSSAYALGGIISYANSLKVRVLGVNERLLDTQGAVSEPVAAAMAEGALRQTDADLAVSITGIAGPDGGSEQKPVGTVCFALASRHAETRTFTERFPGSRDFVRTRSAYYALRLFASAATEKLDASKPSRLQGA
ncbi:MAG: competence/damage-inducible protein A [Polyangiales bacterium]